MDTISRENNTSMLPIGGIVVGVIGLVLGGIGLVQASKANKAIVDTQPRLEKIEAIENQAGTAASAAGKAASDIRALEKSMQDAVNQIAAELGRLQGEITKLQEAAKKPVPTAEKKSSGPVVAGEGEYIIKSGDTFSRIANAQGFKVADIMAVNPGVDSSNLKIGQRIKLPRK